MYNDTNVKVGIDLPIRSVCLTGYKNPEFTKEDYLQMSGRAGRRGIDEKGYAFLSFDKKVMEYTIE